MSIFGTVKPSVFITSAVSASTSSAKVVTVTSTATITTNGYDRVLVLSAVGNYLQILTILTVVDDTTFTVAESINASINTICYGYTLKHSTIDYDFIEPDQLNYTSVINGNKTNTHLGDYGNFRVTEFLWRYTSGGLITGGWTASQRFSRLYLLYHSNVYFAPHTKPVMSDGVPLPCYLKTFKPYMYKGLNSYDALSLEFDVNSYHDVAELI